MDSDRIIGKAIFAALIIIALVIGFSYSIRSCSNTIDYNMKKIDESTKYESLKKVEDTCRAMIASYESDKLMYEQYKDNKNEEKKEWSDQGKLRANKTATSYNNYILKNSFLWKDNIPDDIKESLPLIE